MGKVDELVRMKTERMKLDYGGALFACVVWRL